MPKLEKRLKVRGFVARYRTSVHSTRSQDDAFSYMANFANARQWDPSVVSAEKMGDDPVGLGTIFDLVTEFRGRRVALRYEITTYEAPRQVVLSARTPQLRSRDTITVEARDGGTEVSYDAYLGLSGVARVLDPLLGVFFRRLGDAARDGLARELNS
jgi:hypothetical protein